MSPVFDCTTDEGRADGLAAAKEAISAGRLVVLPTDTVYGLAADAFSREGVEAIFTSKGRGREMPPPVLVPNPRTVDGLAMAMPSYAKKLIKEFWPGGLTLVVRAQQSLSWDLGDTNGTVGLRMPDDELTLTLLAETGPLAVSSANRTGQPPATTITDAGFQLGPFADVYLDGGPRTGAQASTIVDCTKPDPVLLRAGAVTVEQLREVLGDVHLVVAHEPDSGLNGGAVQVPEGVTVQDSSAVPEATEPTLGQHWQDAASGDQPAPDADQPAPDAEPAAQVEPASDIPPAVVPDVSPSPAEPRPTTPSPAAPATAPGGASRGGATRGGSSRAGATRASSIAPQQYSTTQPDTTSPMSDR